MKPAINTIIMALFLPFFSLAQDNTLKAYKDAQTEIRDMLAGARPLSYERAVYLMENAYWGGNLDYKAYTQLLDANTVMIEQLANSYYKPADSFADASMDVPHLLGKTAAERKQMYDKAVQNYAIYSYMTDTSLFLADSNLYIHLPVKYTFADPMGSTQWANTQVAHLLATGRGNCFAMASLYKIFADRLKTGAAISTAPGHIYISHADENGIMHNIEPGSKNSFPGTGTLATITYSSDAAVANGIAMRSLTDKEAVATCLVYLAKGYEKQYNTNADAFAIQCANTALQYDAKNLNAMLLQAEVLERQLLQQNLLITQLQQTATFSEYEALLTKLYTLGYREMPQEMKNTLVALYNKEKTATNCNKTGSTIGVSGGLFPETVPYSETEQYGRTLYNAKTGKITGFAPQAPLYNNYNFDPVVFAWNMDPMTHKFPGESPYLTFGGNPIVFSDVDGDVRFSKQMLKMLEKYPTVYAYFTSTDVTKSGNLLEMVKEEFIINALINNTSHAHPNRNKDYDNADYSLEKFKLTKSKIVHAFTYGEGPFIEIVDRPGNMKSIDPNDKTFFSRGYNYGDDGDTYKTPIELQTRLFELVEEAKSTDGKIQALRILISTFINEYMEDFGRDRSSYINNNGDVIEFGGQVAEQQIFGGDCGTIIDTKSKPNKFVPHLPVNVYPSHR